MPTRKHFPPQLRNLPRNAERGHSASRSDGQVTALVWVDKKPIHFLSTVYDPNETFFVNRRQKDGSALEVSCPKTVQEYNKNMGGCDLNDQMTKLYRTRKHYR